MKTVDRLLTGSEENLSPGELGIYIRDLEHGELHEIFMQKEQKVLPIHYSEFEQYDGL